MNNHKIMVQKLQTERMKKAKLLTKLFTRNAEIYGAESMLFIGVIYQALLDMSKKHSFNEAKDFFISDRCQMFIDYIGLDKDFVVKSIDKAGLFNYSEVM